jgi:phage-related protein
MRQGRRLEVRFFRTDAGTEPVLDWLRALPAPERHAIGDDLRTVQFGWPLGMPLVRKLEPDLWEVRSRLADRIARVIFTLVDGEAVLLHGFVKKTEQTAYHELETARRRFRQLARE